MATVTDAERDTLLETQREAQQLAAQYTSVIRSIPDVSIRAKLQDQISRLVQRVGSAATADQALAAYSALEDYQPTITAQQHLAEAAAAEQQTMAQGTQEARRTANQYYASIRRINNATQQRSLENAVRKSLNAVETAKTPQAQTQALAQLDGLQVQITGAAQNEQQRQRMERQANRRSASEVLGGSHLAVGESKDVRFVDALVTLVIAGASVTWTASRNHADGSDILWGLFWTGLGGVMAVEGRGELRYGGFGVSAANGAYLTLRLFGGIEPTVL